MSIKVAMDNALTEGSEKKITHNQMSFSFLFFSDIRKDISELEKYHLMRDITVFADQHDFEAIYLPERHFSEMGGIYANPAIIAAYLIPQTKKIRFRTAGVTAPLHHPAEIVEWWSMNDILSGGRVDLGFGSGWDKKDFILAPDHYHQRKTICTEHIEVIKKLWRGEMALFPGADDQQVPTQVFPKPVQKELNIWLLVAQNEEAFRYAGTQGYNIFTMLYGVSMEALGKKIKTYKNALKEAGHKNGRVTLMLHTCIYPDEKRVKQEVEQPFKEYIKTSMTAHYKAMLEAGVEVNDLSEEEKAFVLQYAYERYYKIGGLFGTVEEGKVIVEEAITAGVDEIACLVDFGVDYSFVRSSMPYLNELVVHYRNKNYSNA